MQDIVQAVKKWKPDFSILTSVPRTTEQQNPSASLRAAAGWSTGHRTLDRNLDVYVMPPLETVVFLSMLAMGLTHGDNALIAMGLVMNSLVFPALHVWLAPDTYQWKRELSFSTRLTGLYLLSWLVLVTFAPGLSSPEIAAMVPVAFTHFRRNKNADAVRELRNALPIQKMDVDTLSGAPALLESQIPSAAPVRSPKANEHRFAQSRA